LTTSTEQFTVFESMTVLSAVMVHGPEYGVSVVPAGTPVLEPFGNAPDDGALLVDEDELVDGAALVVDFEVLDTGALLVDEDELVDGAALVVDFEVLDTGALLVGAVEVLTDVLDDGAAAELEVGAVTVLLPAGLKPTICMTQPPPPCVAEAVWEPAAPATSSSMMLPAASERTAHPAPPADTAPTEAPAPKSSSLPALVLIAPLLNVVPEPDLACAASSGLVVATPAYSWTYSRAKDAEWPSRARTVVVPPETLLA
jgi:hypothetical protein